VSPIEVIPASYPEVAECVHALHAVVEWQQRSAYWRGAAQGLALGQAHFPWDWSHEDVSSGWPSDTRVVDHAKVLELKVGAAPYADRLLQMDDLLPYQATADAPRDSPVKERDYDVELPFEFTRKGILTTVPVSWWIPIYKRCEAAKNGEPSSSKATEGADAKDSKDGE
jgi:hypothetical protein